jgi:membrane-associated phospholipid phosphatase
LARAGALAGMSLASGIWSSGGSGARRDEDAFRAMNRGRGPTGDRAFAAITELGSMYASGAAALALAARGRSSAAGRALAAAGATWILGQGLKRFFARARPYDADLEGMRLLIGRPRGTSWPSSHPAVATAFLSVAARELALPAAARAGLGAIVAAVGASRIALGVHYPSDVVGGLFLGRAVAGAWPSRR